MKLVTVSVAPPGPPEVTVMMEPEFIPEVLHRGMVRAMLDVAFEERPDRWWDALSRTIRSTPRAVDYVFPETGVVGLERIYQAAVRGQMARVLDLLVDEMLMMSGSAQFMPLWNREGVPQGVRVAAMAEYNFDPLQDAFFTEWMREKGLGDLR